MHALGTEKDIERGMYLTIVILFQKRTR